MMNEELRDVADHEVEIREHDGTKILSGKGVAYGVWSLDLGGFKERIRYGSATETLEKGDIRILFNHDSKAVLGRKSAGTARFTEEKRGIIYEADLPDTADGRDVKELVARKDITGNSFRMMVPADGEEWKREGDLIKRTITKMELTEMGPQTFPAYPQTNVSLRTAILERGIEALGIPAGEAKDLIEAYRMEFDLT